MSRVGRGVALLIAFAIVLCILGVSASMASPTMDFAEDPMNAEYVDQACASFLRTSDPAFLVTLDLHPHPVPSQVSHPIARDRVVTLSPSLATLDVPLLI